MLRILGILLLVSSQGRCVLRDTTNEASANISAVQTVTARFYYGAMTGCPEANTPRMATYGNSWLAGYMAIDGGVTGDGWRGFLLQKMWLYGRHARWVGTLTSSYQTQMGCPVTDAISGAPPSTIVAQMTTLPTIMPTPTSQDIIFLGPMLANPPGPKSLVTCFSEAYWAVTTVAAAAPSTPIYFTGDLNRPDDNMATRWAGGYAACTTAAAAGVNVHYVSISQTVTVGTDDYGPDGVHLAPQGNGKVANAIFEQIP